MGEESFFHVNGFSRVRMSVVFWRVVVGLLFTWGVCSFCGTRREPPTHPTTKTAL